MTTEATLYDSLKYRVEVDEHGNRRHYSHLGQLHRDEGPAIVYTSGAQEWYQNGGLHCTTGPAIIWANGDLEWWQNGKRHREDGPAVVWHDGHKEWWVNDRLHRIDGPALTRDNGTLEWWIHGVQYTKQAYRAQLKTLGIAHDF